MRRSAPHGRVAEHIKLAAPEIFGAAHPPAGGWPATFLVLAYRMRTMLPAALHGALAQTVPCEIIISDDSSDDSGLEALRPLLQGYAGPHRVIVRSTARNLGLCAHMDELARLASAPILFNSAGDDVSKPERVASILAEFAAHPEAMIVGSSVDDVDAEGRLLKPANRGMPRRMDQDWLLAQGKMATILGASMAFRRTLFTGFPPLVGRVEDNMLMLRGALLGECRCLPQPLLDYRRHDNNLGDWVFDRSEAGYAGWKRRQLRVAEMYLQIADDQLRCIEARPDIAAERREKGGRLQALYRLEAEQRMVMIEQPRRAWLGPLWRGLGMPGLRRKSAERALKLLLPRRLFGRG